MLSKTEQRKRIIKTEKRALKMFKNGGDGATVNKLLEQVIKWEELYLRRYGIDLGKYD